VVLHGGQLHWDGPAIKMNLKDMGVRLFAVFI